MRRRLAAAAVAVAVGLTAGGCGGDSSAIEIVRASSAKTVGAESAKVSIALDSVVEGEPVKFKADGAFDFGGRKGVLTLDLGSLLAGTTLETRLLGDTAYVSTPAALTGVLGGKKFLKLDIKALAAQNKQFGSLSGGTDPTSGVEALRGAKDVTEVGKEDVRGESTTHYRGTIDLDMAKSEVEGDAAEAVDELKTLLQSEEIPYDVWIDDDGRVRRTKFVVEAAPSAKTNNKAVSTAMTIELFDFGTNVDVVEPPAAEVADGNGLLAGVGGG
ncbi:MAG TPA: LppX_LprAFG lipoprotein [Mycobacteriales bacterium]|nr:LppX_LprAFG lipoprotein [Mycobacteriales bacterium]